MEKSNKYEFVSSKEQEMINENNKNKKYYFESKHKIKSNKEMKSKRR